MFYKNILNMGGIGSRVSLQSEKTLNGKSQLALNLRMTEFEDEICCKLLRFTEVTGSIDDGSSEPLRFLMKRWHELNGRKIIMRYHNISQVCRLRLHPF